MLVACELDRRVRLFTRPGYDWTHKFPLIVRAMASLPASSIVVDGEAAFDAWLNRSAGAELRKPAANDLLVRWPVSKRVNSSRATRR